jgi:hypothetical protein
LYFSSLSIKTSSITSINGSQAFELQNNWRKTFVTLEPIPEVKQKVSGAKPPISSIKVLKNNLKLNNSNSTNTNSKI